MKTEKTTFTNLEGLQNDKFFGTNNKLDDAKDFILVNDDESIKFLAEKYDVSQEFIKDAAEAFVYFRDRLIDELGADWKDIRERLDKIEGESND